jgi:hypothetical protein
MRAARTADPYVDLDVIDERGPRTNQTVVALVCIAALVLQVWWLPAVMALQLGIGLKLGRKWCLPCRLWFDVLQARLGEGHVEDSRPPRFANQVGLACLTAATIAFLLGADAVGWAITALVAVLASLAALTGLCVGCVIYRAAARVRGVRSDGSSVDAIDPDDVVGEAHRRSGLEDGDVVVFTHPLCADCHTLRDRLVTAGTRVHEVDVRVQRDLARRYGIRVTPTAVRVNASGRVVERLA